MDREKYIKENLEEKFRWLKNNTNHKIIYLALQGSQNYEMDIYSDSYMSDIDVKAICIPSLEDIIKGKKMVSHTYVMEDNSHIDVKDIRLYVDLWKKSNPQFLEILFTDFYICTNDEFLKIRDMAERIAFANKDRLLSSIKGMQMQKYEALKHPYLSIKDKIDKYGYDPKQAHHIVRLALFASDIYLYDKSFKDALIPNIYKGYLLNLKTGQYPLECVEETCQRNLNVLKELADDYRETHEKYVDTECYEILENIIYGIVEDEIKASFK